MAKGTKRKKPGVGIDFRRVKSKVGKKLPKAQNDTDVTFKSKAINLPGQSLTEDKSGQAVSHRNLTLQELLSQLAHYSERVRKDAITGLQQLLLSCPDELARQTSSVLSKLAECISDTDKAVRVALLELLSAAVLPKLRGPPLGPFLPLVMAHLSRALTSLTEAVRNDALDFLEVFLDAAPAEAKQTYLAMALQHFAELLSPSRRSNTVSAKSAISMLKVIQALQRVLANTAAPTDANQQVKHDRPFAGSHQHSLFHHRCCWPPNSNTDLAHVHTLAACDGHLHMEVALVPGQKLATKPKQQSHSSQPGRLGQLLLEELLSCWTECAPGQLEIGPELTAVQCMEAILQCLTSLLYSHPSLFPTGVPSSVTTAVLKKVTPYVPAAAPAVKPSQQMQQALVQLNLAAAKLLGSFLPSTRGASGQGVEEGWRERLQEYYIGVMKHGRVVPSRLALAEDVKQASLPLDVCTAALQGVQAVLPHTTPQRQAALLAAVTSLSVRSSARSSVKAACLEFQQTLLAKGGAVLYPQPHTGVPLLPEDVVVEWVQAVPKLLWQLGTTRPATSKVALHMLHSVLKVAPAGSALSAALDKLQLQLCPLWGSLLDQKASPQNQKGSLQSPAAAEKGFVVGPLAQLTEDTQELAVDLLFFLPTISEAIARTCALICLSSAYSEAIATRIIDVVASRRQSDEDMSNVLSLLVSVLLAKVTKAKLDVTESRHDGLLRAVYVAMQRLGNPGKTLGALDVVLYQNAKADSGRLALKGVLTVVASVASACTAFDPDAYDDHLEPLASPKQPQQHPQHEQTNQHEQQQPAQYNQQQHAQQDQKHEQRPCAQLDQQQHAQRSSADHEQDQQQHAQRRQDGQLEQRKRRMQHQEETFWSHIRNLREELEDIMVHYTLQCNQGPSDSLTETDPSLFASRMQPILQLLTVLGEDLIYYPGRLAQQLLPDLSAEEPAEMIYEHMPPEWYTTPRRGPAGPEQVHAALDALLLLCQHHSLLPYVLARARPHHMPSALSNCRKAVDRLGALTQAGASAARKCDQLRVVLQGIYGSSANLNLQ